MKLAVFIILDQFADWEGAYLSTQLNQSKDWQVAYASNQEQVSSIGGLQVEPQYQLTTIPEKVDLLVLIGGNSWQLENEKFKMLLKQRLLDGQPVTAICGAVDFMAKNGLLNTYRHTGNSLALWTDFSEYHNQQQFLEAQVVSDRNLVTANGTATLEFTRQVLKLVHFSESVDQELDLYQLGFYQYVEKYGNPFA